jgi:hypothetical protein
MIFRTKGAYPANRQLVDGRHGAQIRHNGVHDFRFWILVKDISMSTSNGNEIYSLMTSIPLFHLLAAMVLHLSQCEQEQLCLVSIRGIGQLQ